jgi:RHH-type transcriptional regulator, rel operon repressor / antitoxin RelB
MPLSLRLDPQLEKRIESYSRETGLTKTYIVSESLREYFVVKASPNLYDLAKDLIEPPAATGNDDKSETRRKRYREYVKAKHARRTSARR